MWRDIYTAFLWWRKVFEGRSSHQKILKGKRRSNINNINIDILCPFGWHLTILVEHVIPQVNIILFAVSCHEVNISVKRGS